MGKIILEGKVIPYFTVGNGEFGKTVRAGDKIVCPNCGETHVLHGGKNSEGEDTEVLLVYSCGKRTLLAAVDNRLVDRFGVRKLEA